MNKETKIYDIEDRVLEALKIEPNGCENWGDFIREYTEDYDD